MALLKRRDSPPFSFKGGALVGNRARMPACFLPEEESVEERGRFGHAGGLAGESLDHARMPRTPPVEGAERRDIGGEAYRTPGRRSLARFYDASGQRLSYFFERRRAGRTPGAERVAPRLCPLRGDRRIPDGGNFIFTSRKGLSERCARFLSSPACVTRSSGKTCVSGRLEAVLLRLFL